MTHASTPEEVFETLNMVSQQNLDIRTVTMGISLGSCADPSMDALCSKVYDHVCRTAERLVPVA